MNGNFITGKKLKVKKGIILLFFSFERKKNAFFSQMILGKYSFFKMIIRKSCASAQIFFS